MEEITSIEQLPSAFNRLLKKLECVERLFNSKMSDANNNAWLDLKGLCDYLPENPKPATVYGWVNSNSIPFYKASNGRLRFKISEIDGWIEMGRNKTQKELDAEAHQSLKKMKGGKK